MSEAELEAAGLLEGIDDPTERRDRVELAQELRREGFAIEELEEANRRGRLGLLLVDRVLESEDARFTSVDVAAQSELPLELLTRLWRALGLPEADEDDVTFATADVEAARTVANDIITREELVSGRIEGSREVTVCFADLVGFTRLGERVAPVDLSRAERLLTELALEAARAPVRLVKTIGDAAMLVSTEPGSLVEAALALVDEAERRSDEMPALRAGLASGPAISQRGDWFGAPVNLASRLTDVARPGSVLVTRALRDGLREQFAWSPAGKRRFRGMQSETQLYRARLLT